MITWQGKLFGYETFDAAQILLLNELEAIYPMEFMSVTEWVSTAEMKGLITFAEWDKLDDALNPKNKDFSKCKLNNSQKEIADNIERIRHESMKEIYNSLET